MQQLINYPLRDLNETNCPASDLKTTTLLVNHFISILCLFSIDFKEEE